MKYWKRIDAKEETTTVESYSHNLDIEGAVEISKEEFDEYLASLPPPELLTPFNVKIEIDALKGRIEKLEKP